MTIPQLDRLRTHCHRPRLYQIETDLPTLLEQAAKREQSYADFLDELFGREVGAKTQKHLAMRVAMARFPFQKTLETFDFKFQPSIDPKVIRELATGRYIESGDNVLLLGPPGVGKTHLAVALGLKACEQGVRTLFTTAAGLIATVGKALAENRLDDRLKLLGQAQLLVIDEIGYIPIDRQGANLFFQLVSRRYERGAIILTSKSEPGRLGRGVRRDRHGHPRSSAPSLHHRQHQGRQLPTPREAQGRPAQAAWRRARRIGARPLTPCPSP
jgi:DNA replication protein DnaC